MHILPLHFKTRRIGNPDENSREKNSLEEDPILFASLCLKKKHHNYHSAEIPSHDIYLRSTKQ